MCGIFGVVSSESSKLSRELVWRLTKRMFYLSESRGKEASGLTFISSTSNNGSAASPTQQHYPVYVMKSPAPAAKLIRTKEYKDFFAGAFNGSGQNLCGAAFGHTRLVTNGSQLDDDNNQPVIYDQSICVHNGIIVNVDDLWIKNPDLERTAAVDTEVFLALLRKYYRQNKRPIAALRQVFSAIQGTASIAVAFADLNIIILATNHGSLYIGCGGPDQPIYFASERYTLDQLFRSSLGFDFGGYSIQHIEPNQGVMIGLADLSKQFFDLDGENEAISMEPFTVPRDIRVYTAGESTGTHSVIEIKCVSVPEKLKTEVAQMAARVQRLRRCTTCVLPETVPFIQFDAKGICNFCRNYKNIQLRGRPALEDALRPYRRPGREPDCVAAVSGGRDSCYGLHYLVKELGMKPVAYTYDWGMVTDLARRNIARMCSALGIEHILISANIPWKRENIRKNVLAWLNKPHLGMIPLFMAGDKQFVWYANRAKKHTNLKLDIFTFNLMEKTPFKEEYTGIPFWEPGKDADKLGEHLGLIRGLKLCGFYGKEFLTNPGYWNRSLLDTFYGFVAYYLLPQTFVSLYHYIDWREEIVSDVLINEYDWETATDTESTWRIGDGTASFYNYIYYIAGGFTENDTLRANQIREGHLTREQAMRLVERDNQPRWDSIKWYCDIIGIDFLQTIETINKIKKTHPTLAQDLSHSHGQVGNA